MMIVASVHPPVASKSYQSLDTSSPAYDDLASQSTLYLTLIDSASGKVIHRVTHENGAAPVNAVIIENNIVVTYWNSKAKRTELSSISLFEGMADKYALHPLASSQNSATIQQLERNSNFSSFTSPAPLSMQRSYILPKAVDGLALTVTSHGISNKNILFVLSSGQLVSVDMRLISPRRPLTEPTPSEKEEGLQKYHPIIFLNPQSYVTLDQAMARGYGPVLVASSPTQLESTSAVFSVWGKDLYFNIVKPSQNFDSLASDFNHVMLVLILSTLALVVFVMRRYAKNKQLKSSWM